MLGGLIRLRSKLDMAAGQSGRRAGARPPEGVWGATSGDKRCRKERGVERRPIRRPREKLRVESVERVMPRRRRDELVMRVRCWAVAWRWWVRR